jgi:hypothetical protein
MSGSALCAGWVLMIIVNLVWLAAVLPQDVAGPGLEGGVKKLAPITGAVTGEEQVQVQVGRA